MRDDQRTVRLEVRFSDRGAAGSILALLSRGPGLLLNVLKGRVTSDEAVFELELTGKVARVEEAVWRLWTAAAA